ncbi:hypothetical protein NXH76_28425 [Blautia schinkii]|nr:hypothetical protein [Blautia schinkii]
MYDATMPLLESLVLQHRCTQDTVILHINHCMDNSFYFTEQLKNAFGQVVFVAVPYNDRGVPAALSYAAYHGKQTAGGYMLMKNNRSIEDCAGDFLCAVRRMIALALNGEIKEQMEQGKNLLIVEDGGYHYPVLEQWLANHPALAGRVLGCVEQTTAGLRAGGEARLLYPVASVARSAYKVRVEAYFVADRVVGELKRMLRRQGSFVDFHHVLLLGYGIIGRSIAACIKPHHVQISVWDTDAHIRQTAEADGHKLWDGEFTGDMLVLCSVGKPSFTGEMLDAFLRSPARRIYIASASSKQVEFQDIFGNLAHARRTPLYQADAYRFPGGKEVVMLAQGFPLNFYDKSSDSLTYDMIDPVFSEILLCARTLREQKEWLAKQIYLFGIDEALGGNRAEKVLLERWMTINHIQLDIDTFNRHPQEAHLRKKALEGK